MMKDKNGRGFPNEQTLKRIQQKFSDPNYEGNFALPENASEVDKAKYQLCQLIAKYQREHGLLQKLIAEKLGIDESRISEILRGKIESFTLDRFVCRRTLRQCSS